MDNLNAEAAQLARLVAPTAAELARLKEIREVDLPNARRAVQRVREELEQRRLIR